MSNDKNIFAFLENIDLRIFCGKQYGLHKLQFFRIFDSLCQLLILDKHHNMEENMRSKDVFLDYSIKQIPTFTKSFYLSLETLRNCTK